MISNKIILIFGGSGSLGNALIKKYIKNNIIFIYSRDENKHWLMNLKYKNVNLNFVIGDIRDFDKVKQSLIRINPHIIIIAAALKHVDKCEFESNEAINTNLIGTQNIINNIENLHTILTNLETTCFVSTDKACSPVNIYGMTKAISESIMIEKAKYITNKKFVNVRYGNVLNSRGSIIPILHKIGNSIQYESFSITDSRMSRFIMTLDESVELIEYAILKCESGDTVIPKLKSMNIKDLIEIFSQKYNKPITKSNIRPGEKIYESLINDMQFSRTIEKDIYYIIKPSYSSNISNNIFDYNSSLNPISKEELYKYLYDIEML
jgi:UDP-N-acetylglucosamine 4,6-dehydratase